MADAIEPGPPEVSHQRIVDLARSVASLNEMMSALIAGMAAGETIDSAWADLAFRTLRESNWQLGFTFNEERPPADWYDKETARLLKGD